MAVIGFWKYEPISYVLDQKSQTYVPANTPSPWWELLRNLGLSFIGVGTIGIVWEVYNRRAQEEATDRLFQKSAERLGERVAGDTTELVVGNRRFVNEVLSDERRQKIVRNLIMAHLNDPAAEMLANSSAEQLSGPVRLQQYEATYFAKDRALSGGKPDPHAILWQSVITNVQPHQTFRYRFEVFRDEDTDKFAYGPDVFAWRYWLAPDEDPAAVLAQFDVVGVHVNDIPLTNIQRHPADLMSVEFSADYAPTADVEYKIETELRLPAPKEASYFHIGPRALCRAVHIMCNVIDSEFDAVAVETLGGTDIRIEQMPRERHRRSLTTTVSTRAWVLPTASVAFVFYKPTKPYNKPGPQTAGVVSAANPAGVREQRPRAKR